MFGVREQLIKQQIENRKKRVLKKISNIVFPYISLLDAGIA